MRFHVTSLPHTQTTKDFCWCAYTAKVRRFCDMMTSLGHEIFLYAGEENEADVTEHIPIIKKEDLEKWYPGKDWGNEVFGDWDSNSPAWKTMNARAVEAIKERKEPRDFLCIIGGLCQAEIVTALPDMRPIEWGIGYEGIINEAFHVFESYAWMHHVYGKRSIDDGKYFDTVIPNSFDDEEFIFSEKKEDYVLYLGRPTIRKGLDIVEELAKLGHKIISAGQGDPQIKGVRHRGVVRGKEKAELLANAKAVLVPTKYIEPFGGVAVEAMLSGTPVITPDFGAFTETVQHGVTGYRCCTLGDFNKAIENAPRYLKPKKIRQYAERFLTKNVRHEYENYFKRVDLLNDLGWYSI